MNRNQRQPRLPHEHDESADSQRPHPEHQQIGRRAQEDTERGLVDTDRGPVLERINDVLDEQAHHRPAHKRG
ncbi:MAG TPA: hypothetical protein VGQ91_14100 [Ideonella sp.]|jgi:hypothetical protein|nr:hypothetical protein [Ideonella sp.]